MLTLGTCWHWEVKGKHCEAVMTGTGRALPDWDHGPSTEVQIVGPLFWWFSVTPIILKREATRCHFLWSLRRQRLVRWADYLGVSCDSSEEVIATVCRDCMPVCQSLLTSMTLLLLKPVRNGMNVLVEGTKMVPRVVARRREYSRSL